MEPVGQIVRRLEDRAHPGRRGKAESGVRPTPLPGLVGMGEPPRGVPHPLSRFRPLNILRGTPGAPVRPRPSYEHLLRSEGALPRLRQYSATPPLRGHLAPEKPGCTGPLPIRGKGWGKQVGAVGGQGAGLIGRGLLSRPPAAKKRIFEACLRGR